MDKKYKEISFGGYTSIEDAVAKLQEFDERGEAVYGAFNGHMLFSDRITVDGAYLELFGMDKADFEKAKLEQQGHSGGSLGLVLEMIKQFSHRGAELAELF